MGFPPFLALHGDLGTGCYGLQNLEISCLLVYGWFGWWDWKMEESVRILFPSQSLPDSCLLWPQVPWEDQRGFNSICSLLLVMSVITADWQDPYHLGKSVVQINKETAITRHPFRAMTKTWIFFFQFSIYRFLTVFIHIGISRHLTRNKGKQVESIYPSVYALDFPGCFLVYVKPTISKQEPENFKWLQSGGSLQGRPLCPSLWVVPGLQVTDGEALSSVRRDGGFLSVTGRVWAPSRVQSSQGTCAFTADIVRALKP